MATRAQQAQEAREMETARNACKIQCDQVEEELKTLEDLVNAPIFDNDDVAVQAQVVDAGLEAYKGVQNKLKEMLLKANLQAEVVAEVKKLSTVQRRHFKAQLDWQKKLPVAHPPTAPVTTDVGAYRVNLPRRDIPKFGGDIRQWNSWEAAFSEIDKDTTLPDIEKYNYLLQYTVEGSSARKVVSSFPAAATSYDLAKKELEARFGRKDLLINVYVRDLVKVATENERDKKGGNFIDTVTVIQSHILNLGQLGVTKDKYGILLYAIVESCIPVEVLTRYLEGVNPKRDLEDLMDFLVKEVRRREETALAQSAFSTSKEDKRGRGKEESEKSKCLPVSSVPTATNFFNASSNNKSECAFCGNSHPTTDCRKAILMTLEDKKSALKASRRCFSCLQPFSKHHKCKAMCIRCKKTHHTLMCPDNEDRSDAKESGNGGRNNRQRKKSESEPIKAVSDMTVYVNKPEVLLETMMVYLHSRDQRRMIRVMIDGGSQSTYITKDLVEELGLSYKGKDRVIHQVFGGVHSPETVHDVYTVEISGVHHRYNQHCRFVASACDKIATGIIAAPQGGAWTKECEELRIPLIDAKDPSDIDMLIGNDISPYLKAGMKSLLLKSGLVATETKVGWFLDGKIPGTDRSSATKAMVCIDMQLSDKDVTNLWSLEALGIQDADVNKSRLELEQAAMDHFLATVKQLDDGRYEVRLPFIEGHPALPSNRDIAIKRLQKTTQDLLRDGTIGGYNQVFEDWKDSGIIEEVTRTQPSVKTCHYLPHRHVYKENSTTKIRPVFDASARKKYSPSLNDCLEKGPNLLEVIPTILMGFRIKSIGVVSDIRKAFLQVSVAPEDRDCIRFLWWKDITSRKGIVEYRHQRVVFGISSSPFILGAVIQHLLTSQQSLFPATSQMLLKSFYVDNCVTSLDSLQEAKKFEDEARAILMRGQLDLRGWEYGPSQQDKEVSVLGLLWNTKADVLSFNLGRLSKRQDSVVTKRGVLSMSNSIFDPLGFLSPIIVNFRILFKRICLDERKFSWDAVLPDDYVNPFLSLVSQVDRLAKVRIPRSLAGNNAGGWVDTPYFL